MLIHWIWFAQLQGISQRQKISLLRHIPEPEDYFHAGTSDLEAMEGLSTDVIQALTDKDLAEARRITEQCRTKGISILTYRDTLYPERLRNVEDCPVVLYYRGNLPDFDAQPVVGLVGTRKATPYGLRAAKSIAGQVAACGGLVISGGAAGVDTAAMEAALDADQTVVGVLGCGVDVVYPPSNRRLFEKVAAKGCLLSEYPPESKPDYWHFPQRNRIISGLSHGILVVEAPRKSGALITARCALEQGRDVFTVPGNIDSAACEGSNALLLDGAQPVLSGWDLLQAYAARFPDAVFKREVPTSLEKESPQHTEISERPDKKDIDNPSKPPYSGMMDGLPSLSQEEKTLLSFLRQEPILMDEVIAQAQMPAAKVLSMMTVLSLKGVVTMHPGRRVSANY